MYLPKISHRKIFLYKFVIQKHYHEYSLAQEMQKIQTLSPTMISLWTHCPPQSNTSFVCRLSIALTERHLETLIY